jgi:pimeloyl-ACP methyl ester carboxylesterase
VADEADSDTEQLIELLSGVVSTVERVHYALSPRAHDALSSWVYDMVRAGVVTSGGAVEALSRIVDVPQPLGSGAVQRAIGVVNGAFGGHGRSRGGAMPAAMTVRLDHRRVGLDRDLVAKAYPTPSERIVVFLHGLVETERSWFYRTDDDFGSRLADDLPCSPVFVRYNTGRHISDNGRLLVDLLDQLVGSWPVPVTEIVLIGHSMGGLVARSAVHQANAQTLPWRSKVTRLVCLGSPHTGAPLERGAVKAAALLDRFAVLAPLVRLLALRSDGIKDLARGSLHNNRRAEDGTEGQPVDTTVPADVRQLFVTATLSRSEGSLWGRLVGDLLVTPASAGDRAQTADFEWLGGLHHFDLLRHDAVYDAMLGWLRSSERGVVDENTAAHGRPATGSKARRPEPDHGESS